MSTAHKLTDNNAYRMFREQLADAGIRVKLIWEQDDKRLFEFYGNGFTPKHRFGLVIDYREGFELLLDSTSNRIDADVAEIVGDDPERANQANRVDGHTSDDRT